MSEPRGLEERSVPVPGDLRRFLVRVNDAIGRGEPEALIPSDDLLQNDRIYGGLNEGGGDVWGFTYFPTDDWHPKWELVLTRGQIAGIAEGTEGVLTLWFCTAEGCGVRVPIAGVDVPVPRGVEGTEEVINCTGWSSSGGCRR